MRVRDWCSGVCSSDLMRADRNVARRGVAASLAALFSAAACCVLPLALGAIGIGAGGLAVLVPLHWPLTLAAGAAVSIGWLLDVRRRRACSSGEIGRAHV